MKLIRVFMFFVIVSLILGVGFAFNGQKLSTEELNSVESSEEDKTDTVLDSDEEKNIVEAEKKTDEEKNQNIEKENSSSTNKESNSYNETSKNNEKKDETSKSEEPTKKNETKEEITKSEESTKKNEIKNEIKDTSNEKQVESKNENSSQSETKPNTNNNTSNNVSNNGSNNASNEQPIWEKIGISEYEYYNSPMYSYQTVTHDTEEKCNSDANIATEVKFDPETGMSYQDYTQAWCFEVISYSGRTLGFMLSLS